MALFNVDDDEEIIEEDEDIDAGDAELVEAHQIDQNLLSLPPGQLRIVQEYNNIVQNKMPATFTVETIPGNPYEWKIFYKGQPGTQFAKDIATWAASNNPKGIEFRLVFPEEDYPLSPPFLCLITPAIKGGTFYDKGAFCQSSFGMNEWSPSFQILSWLANVFFTIEDFKPTITSGTFTIQDAMKTYKNLYTSHHGTWGISPWLNKKY